jgi:hypothetical protein
MITMNSLTEENILKNIQRRFAKNIIYVEFLYLKLIYTL